MSENWVDAAAFNHLRVDPDGWCWWCRQRPATTGEHKFKRSDLARTMGDGTLIWGDGEGRLREIRGDSGVRRDRYRVLKFPKSMCDRCNNARSQPFDYAYDLFSERMTSRWLRIMPGVSFVDLYGGEWRSATADLARYYVKHFGCRMVHAGVPVPESLRDFLNGAADLPDCHLALIATDSVQRAHGKGLSISPDVVWSDMDRSRFIRCVMAAYVGGMGVRFEWREGGFGEADLSQFFDYPNPVINCFVDETAVAIGETRRPGWFARFSQWVNEPARHEGSAD